MNPTALVIGANGHLGSHVVRLLESRGQRVRAFVRRSSDLRGLHGTNAEVVRGDVLDSRTLAMAVDGCDEVYHLASPTDRQPDALRTIVEGTRNVLQTCRVGAAKRVVYTSSIVTIGYSSRPDVVLDEGSAQRSDASTYHAGKWLAEQEAAAFASRGAPDVVIVNPATLVGPLDYRVTPSNAPIQRCLDRGLRLAVPGGITVVHVEDAARGLVLAMQKGRSGARYILGGERVILRDYFALIAAQCGRPAPLLTLPRSAVLAAGALFSAAERLTQRPMPFSFSQARHLAGMYGWYSSDTAVRELGYSWRPAADAVRDYVSWVKMGRPSSYATCRAE
jgi:dihydroflavonol-4-reductase